MWEMIAVAIQKVPFCTPKAYLLARKSIAFETQNGTSDEQRWKILTKAPPAPSNPPLKGGGKEGARGKRPLQNLPCLGEDYKP